MRGGICLFLGLVIVAMATDVGGLHSEMVAENHSVHYRVWMGWLTSRFLTKMGRGLDCWVLTNLVVVVIVRRSNRGPGRVGDGLDVLPLARGKAKCIIYLLTDLLR
jgi:hypothetical protein